MTGEGGIRQRDDCKRSFEGHCFCVCFLALFYRDSGGRTRAEVVSCSGEKTFTFFLILSVFFLVSHGFCVTCSCQ